MKSAVGILEGRVAAAVDLIATLRDKVASLEREILILGPGHAPPAEPRPLPPDPALFEELERLRAERSVVRESVRGLLREIDRVPW